MLRCLKLLSTIIFLVAIPVSTAAAAELVMVDSRACSYCAKFKREVAPGYAATALGRAAPLRLVSPLRKWPEDLAGVRQTPYAPVFILVDRGREVGRFFGYAGEEQFWAQLETLVARL